MIEKISGGFPYDKNQVQGYSELELKRIEKLYDIKIDGNFKHFMLEMGRSDGGLIGDDPIILYRSAWSVRTQILAQVSFFVELQDIGMFPYLAGKPFVFSIESETQYFFLRTAADEPNNVTYPDAIDVGEDPDRVFHFDENNGTVTDTGLSFLDYMIQCSQMWGGNSDAVCRGELLIV